MKRAKICANLLLVGALLYVFLQVQPAVAESRKFSAVQDTVINRQESQATSTRARVAMITPHYWLSTLEGWHFGGEFALGGAHALVSTLNSSSFYFHFGAGASYGILGINSSRLLLLDMGLALGASGVFGARLEIPFGLRALFGTSRGFVLGTVMMPSFGTQGANIDALSLRLGFYIKHVQITYFGSFAPVYPIFTHGVAFSVLI